MDTLGQLAERFPTHIGAIVDSHVVVRLPEVVLGWRGYSRDVWREAGCRHGRRHKGPCEPLPGADLAAKRAFLRTLTWPGTGRDPLVMGRPGSIYYDQSRNNWPEAVAAAWLVEHAGIRPEDLVNEVFHLSEKSASFARAQAPPKKRDGNYVTGTRTVARFLPPTFFAAFAALVDANQQAHDINVDLFAGTGEHAALVEVKHEDQLLAHQAMVLAASALAARTADRAVWTAVVRIDDRSTAEGMRLGKAIELRVRLPGESSSS